MGKLKLVILLTLLAITASSYSRTFGKLKQYQQLTEKQVLFETNDGSKILVSALENHAIGICAVDENEEIDLLTAEVAETNPNLNGSIYIEELDELLQITTTSNSGVLIKVDKDPLRFTFVDKKSNAVLLTEKSGINKTRHGQYIQYETEKDEEINILEGDEAGFLSNNENTCIIISSKGYGLFLNDMNEKEVINVKENQLKINIPNTDHVNIDYVFLIGGTELELMTRYAALNHSNNELQYTLK